MGSEMCIRDSDYVARALEVSKYGVAIFAKTDFLHGVSRFDKILRDNPPVIYAPFVEAIGLSENISDTKGVHKRNYAWFVWLKGVTQPTRMWPIEPCKELLERNYDSEINTLMPVTSLERDDG